MTVPEKVWIDRGHFGLSAYRVSRNAAYPVLLLSNSLGASTTMWENLFEVLGAHFQLICYDARGHGRSQAPDPPYSLAGLASDAVAVLDHFDVPRAHLLGLSLGGVTALRLALDRPDRVISVACCNARADAPEAVAQGWEARIAAVKSGGVEAVLEPTFQRWFMPKTRERDSALVAMLAREFCATSVPGYVGCAQALQRSDLFSQLGLISAPVLYAAGAHDLAAPPEVMRLMAAKTPNATFVEIPGAAHLSSIDEPGAFAGAVAAFHDALR